jgi:hypothetical protein
VEGDFDYRLAEVREGDFDYRQDVYYKPAEAGVNSHLGIGVAEDLEERKEVYVPCCD